MALKDYKLRHKKDLEAAVKQAGSFKSKGFEQDPDAWFPKVDKAGNGVAIIRFWPGLEKEMTADDELLNIVRYYDHRFQVATTGKWYINTCISTLDPDFTGTHNDPVMQYTQKLYNAAKAEKGKDLMKESIYYKQAQPMNRKVHFVSNIFVVGESPDSGNKGMLKRYTYGQEMYNVILKALSPVKVEGMMDEAEEPLNPFDLYEGANLKIMISNDPSKKDPTTGKPYRKYEYKWLARGPLFLKSEEAKLEKLYDEVNTDPKWSLRKFIDPKNFKSYDELHQKLVTALGFDPLAIGAPLTFDGAVAAAAAKNTAAKRTEEPKPQRETSAPVRNEETPPWADEANGQAEPSDDFFEQFNSPDA